MNSKLGRNFGIGVLFLLAAMWFLPATAGAFPPGGGRPDQRLNKPGPHRSALGIWRNSQMIQYLKLTEDQVRQLRDLDFNLREKRVLVKAQLDSLHLQMEKAFSEETVDQTAVLQLAEKISGIMGKMFVQDIESRLAFEEILNADQILSLIHI